MEGREGIFDFLTDQRTFPTFRLPVKNLPASRFCDDVGDPGGFLADVGAGAEYARAFPARITPLPVHRRLRKARLCEQFGDLRQGPQAPLVGERILQLRTVLELEVDVVHDAVVYRANLVLIPDVGEAVH